MCARELKITSKIKADPGIFISLETLRRLEAKAKKNGTEGITTITPSENSVDVDNSVISTTTSQDIENDPVSNDPDEANETTNADVENQTNQPTNDTKTDGSVDEPITSIPNRPDTNQQYYPNHAESQQALLAYQKIKWPLPQYQYDWSNQNYYQPNPYQQMPNGAANQQNLGYQQMNPVLVNQRILYHYNDPQPFSINPQITFDPNQHYQQTFIVQHPYPINHPSNPQMN